MIELAPIKSSLWSSRSLNNTRVLVNERRTSFLQPTFHEIEGLHPNYSIEVSNILSMISHHCIFRFLADRVDTFKQMNVELQTFKLSKYGSKQKICISSTKFRWYLVTFPSELLRRSLENNQLYQP
jgi:hypothetical protein